MNDAFADFQSLFDRLASSVVLWPIPLRHNGVFLSGVILM